MPSDSSENNNRPGDQNLRPWGWKNLGQRSSDDNLPQPAATAPSEPSIESATFAHYISEVKADLNEAFSNRFAVERSETEKLIAEKIASSSAYTPHTVEELRREFVQLQENLESYSQGTKNELKVLMDLLSMCITKVDQADAGWKAAEVKVSKLENTIAEAVMHIEYIEKKAEETNNKAAIAELRRDTFEQVWETAPLRVHLTFARDLLDREHPLRPVLEEAIKLDGVRQKRVEFEGWIESYPLLCVESATRLRFDPAIQTIEARGIISPIERLALDVRARAEYALEANLQELGVQWISPQLGEPVSDNCTVVGEEVAPDGVSPGMVMRVVRLGYLWRGRVQQPPLVWRTSLSPTSVDSRELSIENSDFASNMATKEVLTSPSIERESEAPVLTDGKSFSVAENTSFWPDWIKSLITRSVGLDSPEVAQEITAFKTLMDFVGQSEVDDGVILDCLRPLLSLLTSRGARRSVLMDWGTATAEQRPALLAWLESTYGVTLLHPVEQDPFDANTMEAIGTRPTAFARDADTIAKVETIGLKREDRILLPARVLRYSIGGGS